MGNKIDILLISETSLDDTFPSSQCILEGFTLEQSMVEA